MPQLDDKVTTRKGTGTIIRIRTPRDKRRKETYLIAYPDGSREYLSAKDIEEEVAK